MSVQNGPTLVYDPLGRLVELSQAPYLTRFLYDGDALVADYDGSGTVVRRYVHGPNVAADDPLVQYDGSNLAARRFLETDHQGSVILISDANGGTLATNRYDEYGVPASTNAGRFGYTGQQFMGELSMSGQPHAFYYYKARIYRADIGRFLQVDPIGYDDQINLYAYTGSDPVNSGDPDGLGCTGSAFAECTGLSVMSELANPEHAAFQQPGGPTATQVAQNKTGSSVDRILGCESAMTCAMSRDDRAVLSGDMSREEYWDRARARAGGVAVGSAVILTIVGSRLISTRINFGLNPKASEHAWRHVLSRGLNVKETRSVILQDARRVVGELRPGQTMTRTVRVQGKSVEYNIHRLPDGRVNIGSIRPPR